jgi:hypothetical protein
MAFTDVLCPKLQESLTNIAGDNVGLLNRQPVGFLDMLVSPENTSGFTAVPTGDGGRRRTVDIIYMQPDGPGSVTITESYDGANFTPNPNDDFCDARTKKEPIVHTQIVRYKACATPLLLDTADMRRICYESTDQFRATLIMSQMDELNRAINGHIQAIMATKFGALAGTPTQTSPTAPYTPTIAPNPIYTGPPPGANYIHMAEVLQQYERIGGRRRPLVVGAGNIGLYARILNVGCCNQEGIDLSRASGEFLYFRDEQVNAPASPTGGWGVNNYGVFSPGSVQLLTFTDNAGEFRNVSDTFAHDTITDPVTGLTFDFNLLYKPCERVYSMGLCIWFDLFTLPLNMYPAGHALEKVNGTFLVKGA